MHKKRPSIRARDQKRVYQEAGSRCPFCLEAEVSALEIHHIDCDPGNNAFENLILACATCHSKITSGVISEVEVRLKKSQLQKHLLSVSPIGSPAVSVAITGSVFRGDIAQNITKITTPRAPRIKHPDGSIGADLQRKGYIDYLIERYYNYRSADTSYGRQVSFSYPVIHKNIRTKFGYRTFFMPVELFPTLVSYLQDCIDRTIQGRRNCAKGIRNYHSFDEHLKRYQLGT